MNNISARIVPKEVGSGGQAVFGLDAWKSDESYMKGSELENSLLIWSPLHIIVAKE